LEFHLDISWHFKGIENQRFHFQGRFMAFSHPQKSKKFIGHELAMKKIIGFSWQM